MKQQGSGPWGKGMKGEHPGWFAEETAADLAVDGEVEGSLTVEEVLTAETVFSAHTVRRVASEAGGGPAEERWKPAAVA